MSALEYLIENSAKIHTIVNALLALGIAYRSLRIVKRSPLSKIAIWHLISAMIMMYFFVLYVISSITTDLYLIRSGTLTRIGVTFVMTALLVRFRLDKVHNGVTRDA